MHSIFLRSGVAAWFGAVIFAGLGACSPVQDPSAEDCAGAACDATLHNDATAPTDMPGPDTGGVTPGPTGLVAIAIRPAAPRVVVRDGVPATVDFSAVGTLADGTELAIGVVLWSVPPSAIATIDNATGRLTATGAAGGTVDVTAQVARPGRDALTARTTVDVQVQRTLVVAGAPADAASHFDGPATPDPARAVALDYPLDRAVMPGNVAPPDVQWENGVAGDVYRVRLSKPHASVAGVVLHTGAAFRYDWAVDADAWRALLESDPADPVVVTVDRWDSVRHDVVPGPVVTVQIVRGALSGSIYYWDLSEGKIYKIDALTATRAVAVPMPPADPSPDPAQAGSRCVACHNISRDGRYMSAEMWGGGLAGAAFDLSSADLAMDPAPTVFGPRPDLAYLFSTWSPDSNYLVINSATSMALLRRATGMVVPGAGLPAANAAHPEWSPDGHTLAYISNTDGTWAVDFTRGDLTVAPRTAETTFGAPMVLHPGASTPGGTADAHPSFTPNSLWIAFQHGVNSRSGNTEGTGAGAHYVNYPGRLELEPASGGAPLVLANANGAGADSYWPNFSPFNVGGYFWLVFYSRRDYGNAQAGTRGAHRRQLWVAAVSNTPTAPADPSRVPYWLPGQTTTVENISAYWAPVACRMSGTECRTSSECCSGTCTRGPDGMYSCMPPPAAQCRMIGTTCSANSDCCTGLVCDQHVCGHPPG